MYVACVHQRVGLGRVARADLDHPAVAVGVLVDRLGLVAQRLVDLDDLAGQRRDDVGDGLDRLDLGVGLVLVTVVPTSGGSKNTTSPSASCAYQVIPNVAVVAVDRAPSRARRGRAGPRGSWPRPRSGLLACRAACVSTTAVRVLAAHVDLESACRARRGRPAGRPCRSPTPRLGDSVPLVTSPPPTTGLPWRAMPGPVDRERRRASRRARLARVRATASEPMKPVSSLQHQPRPASIGPRSLDQVVAVEVEADLQAQRVARAEPDRASRRRRTSASHTSPARVAVDRAARRRPRRCSRCRTRARRRAGDRSAGSVRSARAARPSASARDELARLRALDGEHRVVVRRGRATSTSKPPACCWNQARSRSWLAALVTVRKCSSASR